MNCLECGTVPDNNRLLTCGCYICSDCYVKLKTNKINLCPICSKVLRRGKKLNF